VDSSPTAGGSFSEPADFISPSDPVGRKFEPTVNGINISSITKNNTIKLINNFLFRNILKRCLLFVLNALLTLSHPVIILLLCYILKIIIFIIFVSKCQSEIIRV
jgi:hypothetical protein